MPMIPKTTYPNIDMKQTGIRLKSMLEAGGYTPRMIQAFALIVRSACLQMV